MDASLNPFPRRLRAFVAVLVAAVACATVIVARGESISDPLALVIFVALVVIAEHRPVLLPGDVFVSGGFMVGMAAVVVFAQSDFLLGAVIIGIASGIYIPHLHRATWGWIPFNAALLAIAYLSAAVVYAAMPPSLTSALPGALAAAVPATVAYVLANIVLLVVSYAIESRKAAGAAARSLLVPSVQAIPFGLLGVMLGRLYLDLGASVALLMVVPVLVAREMFRGSLEVRAANDDTLRVLIRALEAKDRYTAGHSERVATYARYIGEELNLSPGRLERLRVAALCHDIGKLVVPNHLLNKPGRLTEAEFERVKLHEQVTHEILSHIDFLAPIAPTTTHAAAKYDAEDPTRPIEPFAIAVADAFDAMTSTRSYRRALSQDVAVGELRECAGRQFDPTCVEALVRALDRRGERHGAGEAEDDVEQFTVAPPSTGLGSAGLGNFAPSSERSVG